MCKSIPEEMLGQGVFDALGSASFEELSLFGLIGDDCVFERLSELLSPNLLLLVVSELPLVLH
jgi:hypothetical protein